MVLALPLPLDFARRGEPVAMTPGLVLLSSALQGLTMP